MDWDKQQLEANIIDAWRNPNAETVIRNILRFFAIPDNNGVYDPQGIQAMLVDRTPFSKSQVNRTLGSLQERRIIDRHDQFSLQLNPQFSSKGTKVVKYTGPLIMLARDERKYLQSLDELRIRNWTLLGKNKRYINGEETMKRKLNKIEKQNDRMLSMLEKLLERHPDQDARKEVEVIKEERRHLHLVESAANDE